MKRQVNVALIAIVGEGLLSRLSFGLISFTLPLYARHLGLSLPKVGILAALNSAVAVALKPLLGWAADHFGLKRTYLAAISLRSLVAFCYGFASAPWELFAIRSADGLSMSLRDPSANALIAEHGGEKSVASAFAWYQTAKTVASSVSKVFAGILLAVTAANYSLVFFVAFALSVLPLLVVARYVKDQSDATRANSWTESSSVPLAQRNGVDISAGATQVRPKVLPFVVIVYGISTFATIFSGPVFGWLSDNVSRTLVLMVRGVANTLSSILYVVAPTFAGVGVAKTVDDMGKAAFRPAWGALMAQVSSFDKRHRARTMSWMSMGEDAGGALGPMLAGLLWGTWGITALMGSRVLLAIVTEAYAFLVTRPAGQGVASVNARTVPLSVVEGDRP